MNRLVTTSVAVCWWVLAYVVVVPVAFAADIDGPDKVAAYKLVKLAPTDVESKSAGYVWDIYPYGVADVDERPDGRLTFTGPPGVYSVTLRVIDFETKSIRTARKTITIGGEVPPPGPGPPPGPAPEPQPDPAPQPQTMPIAAPDSSGLRVLIVYDPSKPLTSGQVAAVWGKETHEYLTARTPKGGPDGRTPEYRVWSADMVTTGAAPYWSAAHKRPRKADNWIVVQDGTRFEERELPGTPAEMMQLLRKYGG